MLNKVLNVDLFYIEILCSQTFNFNIVFIIIK